MFIDSHCHLNYKGLIEDQAAVLARARAAGVGGMLNIATRESEWDDILGVAERESDVWASVGIHPHEADAHGHIDTAKLLARASHPRVVAIGETGLGVDASDAALAVASGNAQRLGLANRAHFVRGDWGQGIVERFDLILCNPPYVESGAALAPEVNNYEPHAALFAGNDGLADYRRLIPQLKTLMSPAAIAALEIGAEQATEVITLAREAGLTATLYKDLACRDRCLLIECR